jgi:ER membrane protein complex subunit 7
MQYSVLMKVRLDIKDKVIKAFHHKLGTTFDTIGRELEYPLDLTPTGRLEYFQERKGFSIITIFSNPMILMSLVTIGMMFLLPKMKESIQDPEIRKVYSF